MTLIRGGGGDDGVEDIAAAQGGDDDDDSLLPGAVSSDATKLRVCCDMEGEDGICAGTRAIGSRRDETLLLLLATGNWRVAGRGFR